MPTYQDIKNYFQGNYNWLISQLPGDLNPEIRKVAERRINICSNCEYLNQKESKCEKCGCGFPSMTFAIDKHCPIGKW